VLWSVKFLLMDICLIMIYMYWKLLVKTHHLISLLLNDYGAL